MKRLTLVLALGIVVQACSNSSIGSPDDDDGAIDGSSDRPPVDGGGRVDDVMLGDGSMRPPADPRTDAGPSARDGEAKAASAPAEILTNRNDNARTGANLREWSLTTANVPSLQLLGSWPVEGEIYAQVLVASDVEVQAKPRTLAVVATMSNHLYAFDVDAPPTAPPVWHLGTMWELGVPAYSARNIRGLNGILSTPVIDKAHNRLYVVARDCDPALPAEAPRCAQRLFEIGLGSGEIITSVVISGHVTVDVPEASARKVTFDASAQWNRPGLLLAGDELIVAFGSGPSGDQHEEDFVYHGWLFRFDVRALNRAPDVYCTTPRGRGGSIWQSGAGPAADERAIYVTGANGIMADGMTHPPEQWPVSPKGQEDSVVRLARAQPFPTPDEPVEQYWDGRSYRSVGNVFQHMESGDNGFGSSGPMLIPDTNLLLVGSKAGLVYLLDRESMNTVQEPLNPYHEPPLEEGHTLHLHGWWNVPMITQNFTFWRPRTLEDGSRYAYMHAWPYKDKLRSLRYDYESGKLETFATAQVAALEGGGNVVLSANEQARETGVLWAATRTDVSKQPGGQLWAFDAITLEVLFHTDTPAFSKFTPPTVIGGRVYLPSTSSDTNIKRQVLIFGLPLKQQ
jgi:hypothetical protein